MVAGIAFFGIRAILALIPFVALRWSTKKCAATGALLVTFLYLLLSDATVSSRRAFVICGLMLLGVILDRVTLSARTLAYAAVAIMLLAPESTTGPSFQMSFAAVAGLVACYETLRPRLAAWHAHAGPGRRIALYLFGIALTTVVTTVATMPFTIYHFNRFPLYSGMVKEPPLGFTRRVSMVLTVYDGPRISSRPKRPALRPHRGSSRARRSGRSGMALRQSTRNDPAYLGGRPGGSIRGI